MAPNDPTGGTSLIDGYSGVEYFPNFKRLLTRYQCVGLMFDVPYGSSDTERYSRNDAVMGTINNNCSHIR